MSLFGVSSRFRRKRLLLGGGVLVLLFLSGLAAQQLPRFRIREDASREYFRRGVYFHNERQYVAAREFFYKALDVQPSFHLARRFLGDAHYYSGEWNEALEQWELLDSLSGGAYPLISQRSELLRFGLQKTRNPGELVFLREFTPTTWRGFRFERPADVAVDSMGWLYIATLGSASILKVDHAGEVQDTLRGPFYDRLARPIAVSVQDNRLYVCDFGSDRIRVLTTGGGPLFSFGRTGGGDGELRGPEGIAVSGDNVFVSDTGNRRIVRFTSAGVFRQAFGADERGGLPQSPAGLAVVGDMLYVVDREGRAILIYDLDGNFLGRIRSDRLKRPRGLSLAGRRLIVADEESGILFYHLDEQRWDNLTGLRDNRDREVVLNRPFAAHSDSNGVLYLAEYGGHRVLTVVPEGLRVSNLEVRVERVDGRGFPNMAVFVSIRNRLGAPLQGLARRQIRLFENDRRVGGLRTDNVESFQKRANVVFVAESSAFLEREFSGVARAAIGRVVENVRISDRLSVVRVGETVRQVYEGVGRLELLEAAVDGDRTENPNLGKGLYDGVAALLSGLGPRAVVLFASGREYPGAFDQYGIDRISQFAAANGIAVHVISCEGAEDVEERERVRSMYADLSASTGGQYLRAFDETALSTLMKTIQTSRDNRYLITYRSQADRVLTGRYVDVRIETQHQGTIGKGNGGYFIP